LRHRMLDRRKVVQETLGASYPVGTMQPKIIFLFYALLCDCNLHLISELGKCKLQEALYTIEENRSMKAFKQIGNAMFSSNLVRYGSDAPARFMHPIPSKRFSFRAFVSLFGWSPGWSFLAG